MVNGPGTVRGPFADGLGIGLVHDPVEPTTVLPSLAPAAVYRHDVTVLLEFGDRFLDAGPA
jgi:hypothetical protein